MELGEELKTAIDTLVTAIGAAFGITPSAAYEGGILADDRYLLLNTGTTDMPVYALVKTQINEQTGAIDTSTEEKVYIHDRGSKTTNITGKTRSLTISADEYIGDAGMDFLLSKKFATGSDAETDYAIYNIKNGAVEMAKCTINLSGDMSGAAGTNNIISIAITSNGLISEASYIPA